MKVGCFCKHPVALSTIRALRAGGYDPAFAIVQKRYQTDQWYGELKAFCAEKDIPFHEVGRIREAENVDYIRRAEPDLIVSVLYTEIIPRQILDIPSRGIINHHPSLLPAYRGPHPVNWAVINGEERTGLTVHFMSDGVDSGEIIWQEAVPIHLDDTTAAVSKRLLGMIPDAALEVVKQIDSGKMQTRPQDEAHASYFPRRTEKDDTVDWSGSAKQIYDLIRGLYYPLPGAVSWLNGQRIVLRRAQVPGVSSPTGAAAGQIVAMDGQSSTINTGDGLLSVERIDLGDETNVTAGSATLDLVAKTGDCFTRE